MIFVGVNIQSDWQHYRAQCDRQVSLSSVHTQQAWFHDKAVQAEYDRVR